MISKFPNLPFVHLMPFSEIDEKRNVLLVTSAPAWNAVKGYLRGLNVAATLEVTEATTEAWDALLTMDNGQQTIVYAVGGGLTADTGKYIAQNSTSH